ncbi:MAG TPA: alpha/beta fold hydrolase [Jatrophihabitantaceae bacterium]|nr:alpha/beta fold hydrolase [Jatrophihabitantaceae bacterium]
MAQILGTPHDIALGSTTVRYYESGPANGPVVVFVHGVLVNAQLWRKVVPTLAQRGLRCLAVDWPLGSHEIAAPRDADLTPPALAALIADFLDALDLHDVTIVANDTGGALTQLVMTTRPERVGRVVLTNCDCFERFFPPMFAPLIAMARVPGALWLLAQLMRPRFAQRLPIAYGWLAKVPIDDEVMRSYIGPARRDRAVRRDAARVLRGVDKRHTLAAAKSLPAFGKPVLLAWGREDRVFPLRYGEKLAALLPQATLVPVDESYAFVPEDRPDELARLVLEFVAAHAAA